MLTKDNVWFGMDIDFMEMAILVPVLVAQQEASLEISSLVQQGNFSGAVDKVKLALVASPQDPVLAQMLGLLLVAQGDMPGAEAAFTQAIENGPNQKATPTGLEDEVAASRPLGSALRQYRAAFTPEAGIAAAYNNRAGARICQRKFDIALPDCDQAAIRVLEWGVPWLNAAIAWTAKGNPEKALHAVKEAIALGENSAQAHAALAEAEIDAGQITRAREDLAIAEERDATLPYLRSVQVKLLQRRSRVRDAERAFLQGLAGSVTVATDQLVAPQFQEVRTGGGVIEQGHFRFKRWGQSPSNPKASLYRVQLEGLQQQVEGVSNAYQNEYSGSFIVGDAKTGILMGSHRREAGGRPGTSSVTPVVPNYQYGLTRTALILQKNVQMGNLGKLTLDATYRENQARLQPSSQPWVTTLQDKQVGGELQWVVGKWTSGAAWSQINRKTNYVTPSYLLVTPAEPLEQITPSGVTTQGLLYALHQQKLSPFIGLTAGPVYATNNKTHQLQAMADMAFRLTDTKTVHLRTTPHLVAAASDLFPAALAFPVQSNPITQDRDTVNGFNPDPLIPSTTGKTLAHELTFGQYVGKKLRLNTKLFRNELFQQFIQSGDPRFTSFLAVTRQASTVNGPTSGLVATPLPRGKATGLEQQVRLDILPNATLNLSARYQQTDTRLPIHNALGQVTSELRHIPFMPQWQGTVGADWRQNGWTVSAEGFYLGARPTATTAQNTITTTTEVLLGDPPRPTLQTQTTTITRTQTSTAKATAGLNLHLQHAMGSGVSTTFSAYNLGRAQFYPNFPSRTAYTLGINIPF
jgi:tetratricopeptide (TPR) repeat protein